jgi:hypothetical protein
MLVEYFQAHFENINFRLNFAIAFESFLNVLKDLFKVSEFIIKDNAKDLKYIL